VDKVKIHHILGVFGIALVAAFAYDMGKQAINSSKTSSPATTTAVA
jgi:hypothetical protein